MSNDHLPAGTRALDAFPGLGLRPVGDPENPECLDIFDLDSGKPIGTIRTHDHRFYLTGVDGPDGPSRITVSEVLDDAVNRRDKSTGARRQLGAAYHALTLQDADTRAAANWVPTGRAELVRPVVEHLASMAETAASLTWRTGVVPAGTSEAAIPAVTVTEPTIGPVGEPGPIGPVCTGARGPAGPDEPCPLADSGWTGADECRVCEGDAGRCPASLDELLGLPEAGQVEAIVPAAAGPTFRTLADDVPPVFRDMGLLVFEAGGRLLGWLTGPDDIIRFADDAVPVYNSSGGYLGISSASVIRELPGVPGDDEPAA